MKILTVLALMVLFGCQLKPTPEELVKIMLVQTKYDENTAYDFYNSFTLSPDTLGLVSNVDADTLIVSQYAKNVTASIKNNMTQAGYAFLKKNQNPDLGLAAYVVENYNVYQQVNYPTYYYGYYGYGYYGTPYVTTQTYSATSLVINLIDLKNHDAQGRLKVLWTAFIGDLDNSVNPSQNVLNAIDQAFAQSPYLHRP